MTNARNVLENISHKARKEAAMIYQKVSADMKFVDREKKLKSSGKTMISSRRVLITERKVQLTHSMTDLQLLMVSHILDMYLQELLRI